MLVSSLELGMLLTMCLQSVAFQVCNNPLLSPSLSSNYLISLQKSACTSGLSNQPEILRRAYITSKIKSSRSKIFKFTQKSVSDITNISIPALTLRVRTAIIAFFMALLTIPKTAIATSTKIKGWDLYGRVPNDDWLFSTWRLTDPNLYKRSLAETLKDELPQVFGTFKRKKRITELFRTSTGLGKVVLGLFCVGLLYKTAVVRRARRKSNSKSPLSRSTSAIAKKAPTKGVAIDVMGKGWYDMERLEGEEDEEDKKNTNEEEEEEDEDEEIDIYKKKK